MPASTLSATTRYYPVGVRQFYIVDVIADIANASRTELDAGTDVTDEIVDGGISGFMVNAETVPAPDAGRRFTSTIDGRTSVDTCSIAFYTTSDGTTDIRDRLTKGLNTHVLVFPEGDHPPVVGTPSKTWHYDAWPVRVITDPSIDSDMSKPGQVIVTFAATGEPAIRKAVPA